MSLSSLEIYKLLPKTNCRQCGFPTCLAFAMQLAKKAVSIDKCPFLSEEAKKTLEESSLPPIRLITIGKEDAKLEIGNETVLFRHEEKFYHPTGIGVILEDDLPDSEIIKIIKKIKGLEFERIGQKLKLDLIAIRNRSSSLDGFLKVIDLVVKETSSFSLVFMSQKIDFLKKALELYSGLKPLIYKATKDNYLELTQLAKSYGIVLVVSAENLDELSLLTKELNKMGFFEIVLEPQADSVSSLLWNLTQIRRLALKRRERSLGYPTLVVLEDTDKDLEILFASTYLIKYAGILLINTSEPEDILGILTLRQNIYTDPQKPLQIEPKLYPVGTANQNSPVLVTTNFSLTYYTVLGEVEASKIPSYILSVDTEGMSVLTAWAAEKFTASSIVTAMEKANLKEKVSHRSLIIPGYVALMSGELEERSGWQVIVGPKEASGIPSFLKNL
ncbi:MAG: acetyl-CoA decarbonylase/synthase complex subunit gamma [Candidatus Omnitrophica bacterium]|nr:acetyl-CoA decarbonylase/synthase complex subunit gamma [Candidatus Omnitrophota bacterium]MCM8799313.1 acetyl-CoA decarbonylase/synthase complex subunit gamma [Candidatus Omnitrophota bacterium]